MQPVLTQVLNLPGIEVEDYRDFGGQLILEVEAMTSQVRCPRWALPGSGWRLYNKALLMGC
jgi:hypothetical protein